MDVQLKQLVTSSDTFARLQCALEWLRRVSAADDGAVSGTLVIAASWEAADELARAHTRAVGAVCGLQRTTLDRLATRLALPVLTERHLTPASRLTLHAVVARTLFKLHRTGALSYFAPVGDRPGLIPAAARTLEELRMNGVDSETLPAVTPASRDLKVMISQLELELDEAGLADRPRIYKAGIEASRNVPGLPVLVFDVSVASRLESALIATLSKRASRLLCTMPRGDGRTLRLLETALDCEATRLEPQSLKDDSLYRLKQHLFSDTTPRCAPLDGSVCIRSWPGEARECIEIARAILARAAAGVPFDRMAVLLHAPQQYGPHLEEALSRAEIPAFFAGGTSRPNTSGRALLALLACAAERLSARRFAEYLSLAQVPDSWQTSPNREPLDWRPPRHDLAPSFGPDTPTQEPPPPGPVPDPDSESVVGGTLRAPWRWEQLLVDAAVIGGAERWERRLHGLCQQYGAQKEMLFGTEDERVARLERLLADLSHLEMFALPIIKQLDGFPGTACWGEWLPSLRTLAVSALRDADTILEALAELEPMSPVGPVDLDEVRLVLADRLKELRIPPPRRRHGAVFVAPAEMARGLSFDVVFVPGLVEKVFPRQIVEDPMLLDAAREEMETSLPHVLLERQPDRAASERLALRLAVGAARDRLFLSYPRLDVEQGRPRVPSFYALEALRAAEGVLPGFDALHARVSHDTAGMRLGWPAPSDVDDAIDEAEYDLALLAPLLSQDPERTVGTARYLLSSNPHLARALLFQARRWRPVWSRADGLVQPDDLAREALDAHLLSARSYSPTALQNYANCPYRFFLQAVQRLEPREELVAPEVLDPLTRGSLFHEVQFELLSELAAEGMLPLSASDLDTAVGRLECVLVRLEQRKRDDLAPAIVRVWEDGIAGMRADLREWLRRAIAVQQDWIPHHFELSFGLPQGDRAQADTHSVRDPVRILDGLHLRGSIDLVERAPDGSLRATDHKTGKVYGREDLVVQGGGILQPLLYALACEQLLEGRVVSGRLYYCTADGGYNERVVPLNKATREAARRVVDTIEAALKQGFLPAAPLEKACRYCDYRPICGLHEYERAGRKPTDPLRPLEALRSMP